MAEATGLAAVLDAAIGDAPLIPEPAEQPDLLRDLGMRVVKPDGSRPRGRPAGAVNRRTDNVARYLLSRYPDPLEGLLKMASLGVEDLRESLGCSRIEAWQEKRLLLIAALPYIHRRQPLAVDLTTQNVVHLAIHTGPEGEGGGAGDGVVTLLGTIVESEQDQRLSEAPDAPV